MGQKVEVSGTGYDLKGGKPLIGGTAYAIKKGRTLKDGTGYDLSLQSSLQVTVLQAELQDHFVGATTLLGGAEAGMAEIYISGSKVSTPQTLELSRDIPFSALLKDATSVNAGAGSAKITLNGNAVVQESVGMNGKTYDLWGIIPAGASTATLKCIRYLNTSGLGNGILEITTS